MQEAPSGATAKAELMQRDLLTADQVAAWTGLGRGRVYELMSAGALPTVRIGKRIRVYRPALEKWFEQEAAKFDGERLRQAITAA